MAYGTGPYGPRTPPAPGLTTPSLPSSRRIDFKTGRYAIDGDGSFEGMPDLHQRIGLLLAYEVEEPAIIGPSFRAEVEAQIRSALRPLTESRPPAVVVRRIEVSVVPGNSYRLVELVDGAVIKVAR